MSTHTGTTEEWSTVKSKYLSNNDTDYLRILYTHCVHECESRYYIKHERSNQQLV